MKPILFNTEMVRAILEGRKTVTRRVVKPNQLIGIAPDNVRNKTPDEFIKNKSFLFKPYCDMSDKELVSSIYKSAYNVGDVLYVRETWSTHYTAESNGELVYCYKADDINLKSECLSGESNRWYPSIHMPKAAARIFLKVTDVRVERLQDMTKKDMEKEGLIDFCKKCSALFSECDVCLNDDGIEGDFIELWNGTIKPEQLKYYGWEANPYVWVIEFERVDKCSD